MKRITLTKQKAIELLQNMADEQRDLNWKKVYDFRQKINEGEFGFREGSTIGFLNGNQVKNGQHRIMAFLLSNADQIEFTVQHD